MGGLDSAPTNRRRGKAEVLLDLHFRPNGDREAHAVTPALVGSLVWQSGVEQ